MSSTFKRYELKYIMTQEQKAKLMKLFEQNMVTDEFGKSCIYNIYYDTDEFLLIRRSMEKPVYKEKLRIRSYGRADDDTKVFIELKKKYKSIVYKRRIALKQKEARTYFENPECKNKSQIAKEIDYFKSFYKNISPKVFISYDREAFFGKEDSTFRITFDENIIYRDTDLNLSSENYGRRILSENQVLTEIKVANAIPLWLVHFLSENKIYKTSFSKYANAYINLKKENEELNHVS